MEKGICTECGRPVLDTEPRYVHTLRLFYKAEDSIAGSEQRLSSSQHVFQSSLSPLSSPTHALFLSLSFFGLLPFSNMRATTPPRLMMFCLADRWALMALTGTSLAQTVL